MKRLILVTLLTLPTLGEDLNLNLTQVGRSIFGACSTVVKTTGKVVTDSSVQANTKSVVKTGATILGGAVVGTATFIKGGLQAVLPPDSKGDK